MEKNNISTIFRENLLKLITEEKLAKYGSSGLTIILYRINKNIHPYDLAKRLKIRPSTLVDYEHSKRRVGIALAKKLSDIFKEENWRVFRVGLNNITLLQSNTKNSDNNSAIPNPCKRATKRIKRMAK